MATSTRNKPAQETTTETTTLGFLASLQTLATPVTDAAQMGIQKDPLANAKLKFAQNIDENVKLIKSASEAGKFFKKLKDKYMISLRNGNTVMPLNGNTHFSVDSAEAAIKFLEAAKAASENSELDEVFNSTKRAKKQTKTETPAATTT
ncbi:hypothetical protein [Roseateles albus]|uniref:Uncharacterized protein n=1 Tax=Roseateles albus TaxID=2987525 RepID=A0ABT5KI00_9BURK|nr:hypothetical protein [Roseateles albus]MDC8773570.1 hypothetical protein [Roseateles albus]